MGPVAFLVAAAFLFDTRPPLTDIGRLPTYEVLKKMEDQNRTYRIELACKLELTNWWPAATAAQDEARQICLWIDLALAAHSETGGYVYNWGAGWNDHYQPRDALDAMRILMGPAAYEWGWWPPAVPVWRLGR
jgi:hypothetical protein